VGTGVGTGVGVGVGAGVGTGAIPDVTVKEAAAIRTWSDDRKTPTVWVPEDGGTLNLSEIAPDRLVLPDGMPQLAPHVSQPVK
jgi:hypothetical protein